MSPRRDVCWFCRYMHYEQAEPDYSEYTPGSDLSMGCNKGHWHLDAYRDTQADFRRKLTMAETCVDFEPSPSS